MRAAAPLLLLLCLALAGASLLPSLRLLLRHGDDAVSRYLKILPLKSFNHNHAGASCTKDYNAAAADPVSGFKGLTRSVVVGKGRGCFLRACDALFAFSMIDGLGWARVLAEGDTRQMLISADVRSRLLQSNPEDLNLCTNVRCYGLLWSLNPCRVLASSVLRDFCVVEGRRSQLSYSTLEGHLIAGEERFRITHSSASDEVVFEVHSFTRGSGFLGLLAMPLVRPVQRVFFEQQCALMQALAG